MKHLSKHFTFKNFVFSALMVAYLFIMTQYAIGIGFASLSYLTWSDRAACQPQNVAYKALTLNSDDTFQVYSKQWTWSGVSAQREGTNLPLSTGNSLSFPQKYDGGTSLFLPLPGESGQILVRCSQWHFRLFSFEDFLKIEP